MRASSNGAKSSYPRYARRAAGSFSHYFPSALSTVDLITQAPIRALQQRQLAERSSEASVPPNPLKDLLELRPDHYSILGLQERSNVTPNEYLSSAGKSSEKLPDSAKPVLAASAKSAIVDPKTGGTTTSKKSPAKPKFSRHKKPPAAKVQKPSVGLNKKPAPTTKKPTAQNSQKASPASPASHPAPVRHTQPVTSPSTPTAPKHNENPAKPPKALSPPVQKLNTNTPTSPNHNDDPAKLNTNTKVSSPDVVSSPRAGASSPTADAKLSSAANTPSTTTGVAEVPARNAAAASSVSLSSVGAIAAPSASPIPVPSPSAQIAINSVTAPVPSPLNAVTPITISPISSTSNANHEPPDSSSPRVGQALAGVFGTLVLLAAALAAAIFLTKRRQSKLKPMEGVKSKADRSSTASFGAEKASSFARLSLNPSREIDFSVAPVMSPSDPVTRYSQGGITLLKRLQSITATLDHSPSTASFSSDNDSTMAHTPVTELYEARIPNHLENSAFDKIPVGFISPLTGLAETVMTTAEVESPTSDALPPASQYSNILPFWEDPRRSLLRSNSDDGSLGSSFRDEATSESNDYRSENHSTETPTHTHEQDNRFRTRSLTPPNKYDFHVPHGDPHFIIEASD